MKSLQQNHVIKLLLVLISLFFIQPSLAHAKLTTANPSANAVLQASPKELTLRFSEAIELGFSQFTLVGAKPHVIITTAKPSLDAANPNQVHILLAQPLAAGVYEVQWRVLSVDGHKTNGSYDFTVK